MKPCKTCGLPLEDGRNPRAENCLRVECQGMRHNYSAHAIARRDAIARQKSNPYSCIRRMA